MKTTKNWKPARIVLSLLLIAAAGPLFAAADPIDTAIAVSTPAEAEALEKAVESEPEGVRDLCIGIAHHNIAGEFDRYIPTAISHLENAWRLTGKPIALAYLGSAKTIRAGLASSGGDIITAVADLDEGLKNIDEAIALDGDDIELRILRIYNGLDVSVNSPISREKEISADLEMLGSRLGSMDSGSLSLYWLSKGQFEMMSEQWDEAFDSFGKAIAAAPESKYARAAENFLWELEE